MFRCVQEGVPLTTGEKIQAIGGPYGTFIEELRQRYFEGTREDGSDGLDGRVLQCVRGKGSEIVACMFRLVEDLVNSREPNLVQPAAFLKELGRRNAEGPVPGKLKARAIQLLDRFMRLSLIPPTKKIELGSKTAREKMEQMIPAHQVFLGPVVSGRTPSGLSQWSCLPSPDHVADAVCRRHEAERDMDVTGGDDLAHSHPRRVR